MLRKMRANRAAAGLMALVIGLAGPVGAASAQAPEVPVPRSIDVVCPPEDVPSAGFRDVDPAHERAVDCMVHWRVARGYEAGVFRGADAVNRSQMAVFLHRLVYASGRTLPPAGATFPDIVGNPNEPAIRQLVAAGIVTGKADGTYGPGESVSRAQMATFIVRTAEYASGPLPRPADYFSDDAGTTHEPNINAAAAAGLAAGISEPGRFAPDWSVRRDQMGSFLARLFALLGPGEPPVET